MPDQYVVVPSGFSISSAFYLDRADRTLVIQAVNPGIGERYVSRGAFVLRFFS